MTYTALYRKFRPQSFGELVGQEHIGRTLRNALLRGSLVHAYLFSGPRGTGKTSAAKILARTVNCLAPKDGEACLSCPACLRSMAGQSLDIVEIDAASNRGIDEIRDLRERVKYAPVQERYKVYIIDEVHMMTGEAFNALLKTLEEPPEPVIFILATTEPHKIPLTVLSRCQRFDFHRISENEIAGRLAYICRKEGILAEESALELIARKAEGGMRDAVSLLDQCAGFAEGAISEATVGVVLGLVDGDFLRNLAANLCRGELAEVLEAAGQLLASGHDLRHFSYDLQDHLRHLLLLRLTDPSRLESWGQTLSPVIIFQTIQALGDIDNRLRNSLQPRITLELALIQACGLTNWEEKSASAPGQKSVSSSAKPSEMPIGQVEAKQKSAVQQPQSSEKPTAQAPAKQEPTDQRLTKQKPTTKPSAEQEPVTGSSTEQGQTDQLSAEQEPARQAEEELVKSTSKTRIKQPEKITDKPATNPLLQIPLSLNHLRERWPKVLQLLKKENINAYAFLLVAQPIDLEQSTVVIAFSPKQEVNMRAFFAKLTYRQALDGVLHQVYGHPLTARGVVREAADQLNTEPRQDELF